MKKMKLINNEKLDLVIKPLKATTVYSTVCTHDDNICTSNIDDADCPLYSLDVCGKDFAACTLHSQDRCPNIDYEGCRYSHDDFCANEDNTSCHEAIKYDYSD